MTTPTDLDSRDRLTRVETKLDLVLGELRIAHTDHEARIRILEARIGRWAGGMAVISVFLGAAAGIATNIIGSLIP